MRFNLATPVYVYPLGLLGFILVAYTLAFIILATYHPGGVKHATQVKAKQDDPDKDLAQQESDQASMLDRKPSRRPINVVVENLRSPFRAARCSREASLLPRSSSKTFPRSSRPDKSA
jgi:hypothetical protein